MVHCANQLQILGEAMPQYLSDVLDACERMGKLNVRGEELRARLPDTTPEALRKALYRQQRAGRLVRLSRGSDHWLIVPLQHAAAGSPPLEAWLDPWLRKTLGTPYYVGLLSAAETYGASPYAVMVTQVMVADKRRPVTVGRHELVFHVCSRIEAVPTRWHESADGRFKVSTPELAVAIGKPEEEWLGVFIHEACHMEQWIEQSPAWTNVFVKGREAVDWIDAWLEGKEGLPEPIEELVARARTVELDCERRVVEKIKEYGLPLDVEEYAQKANSYVYFYNHLLRTRQWYPAGCSPYENELVYGFAPTVLTLDGQTPPALAAAFERVYPSKKRMVNP